MGTGWQRGGTRWLWRVACALSLLVLTAGAGAGAGVGEYELKAALLFKIARFFQWPVSAFAGPREPLVLCVIGTDPFGPAIDALRGETLNSRAIDVRRLPSTDAAEAAACHVAFIVTGGGAAESLRPLAGRPVLSVGDAPGFARAGGVLGMRTEDDRIRFDVNPGAVAAHGLQISAQLLQLATVVNSEDEDR